MKILILIFISSLVLVSCKKEAEETAPSLAAPVAPVAPIEITGCQPTATNVATMDIDFYDIEAIDFNGNDVSFSGTIRNMANLSNASKPGCSITRYEINVFAGSYTTIPAANAKPTPLSDWQEVTDLLDFDYGIVLDDNSQATRTYSVCLRAITSLNETSLYLCSPKSYNPVVAPVLNLQGSVSGNNFNITFAYVETVHNNQFLVQLVDSFDNVVGLPVIARTARAGSFDISALPSGNYRLEIVAQGNIANSAIRSINFTK